MFEKLSIAAVYPEMLLALMAIVIAMVDLFVKCPRRTPTYALSLLTIGCGCVHGSRCRHTRPNGL